MEDPCHGEAELYKQKVLDFFEKRSTMRNHNKIPCEALDNIIIVAEKSSVSKLYQHFSSQVRGQYIILLEEVLAYLVRISSDTM